MPYRQHIKELSRICETVQTINKPRVALEGSQALQLFIENQRHVRWFSCDFIRNRFITRTNGREKGKAFRPVSECKTRQSGFATLSMP